MTDVLPEGHPLAWEDLVPYEQEQGGYWLYPPCCDVYGNGKIWVRVPGPERPGELDGYANRMYALAREMKTRGLDIRNRAMADLGAELEGLAIRAKEGSPTPGRCCPDDCPCDGESCPGCIHPSCRPCDLERAAD